MRSSSSKSGMSLRLASETGRDERQIKAALEQAGNHLLRHSHGHADFRVGIALSQLSQGSAQLVDQSCNARGEMEWAHILRQVVFKRLLNMAHHCHNLLGELSEAQCRRCRN